MVEVRYGEQHFEVDDLAGKTVAEAREQYRDQLDIPDKAQARLNDKEVKQKLEAETVLHDCDELVFAVKSRKKLMLVAALIAALAGTGGMFAYTWTTASATIGATADSDYAAVEPASSLPTFSGNILGRFRGDVPTGYVFEITPDSDYTGDLQVDVYLTNADELTLAYKHLNMKLELWDSDATTPANLFATAGHTFQVLTLDNGRVSFPLDISTGTSPFKVKLAGGSFTTHSSSPLAWDGSAEVAPLLYCEVTQR